MSRVMLSSLALLVASLITTAHGQGDRIDIDLLQGTWPVASGERKGEKTDRCDGQKLVVSGSWVTLIFPKASKESKGTLKVDPAKKPKTIDVDFGEGAEKPKGI